MKAYVIKNEEGKYLDSCQDFETNNICDARLFDEYNEALNFSPKDCEVVEITTAEGNLQKENEVLRKALELACDELDTWHRSCDNRPDYFIQQVKEQRDETNND